MLGICALGFITRSRPKSRTDVAGCSKGLSWLRHHQEPYAGKARTFHLDPFLTFSLWYWEFPLGTRILARIILQPLRHASDHASPLVRWGLHTTSLTIRWQASPPSRLPPAKLPNWRPSVKDHSQLTPRCLCQQKLHCSSSVLLLFTLMLSSRRRRVRGVSPSYCALELECDMEKILGLLAFCYVSKFVPEQTGEFRQWRQKIPAELLISKPKILKECQAFYHQ